MAKRLVTIELVVSGDEETCERAERAIASALDAGAIQRIAEDEGAESLSACSGATDYPRPTGREFAALRAHMDAIAYAWATSPEGDVEYTLSTYLDRLAIVLDLSAEEYQAITDGACDRAARIASHVDVTQALASLGRDGDANEKPDEPDGDDGDDGEEPEDGDDGEEPEDGEAEPEAEPEAAPLSYRAEPLLESVRSIALAIDSAEGLARVDVAENAIAEVRAQLLALAGRKRDEKPACFVADNGLAPPGWVEIQRDDSPDFDPTITFEGDDHAAQWVANEGGHPGTAMRYSPDTGAMIPLALDYMEAGVSEVLESVREAIEKRIPADACPTWIAIVPRGVAALAGMAVPS